MNGFTPLSWTLKGLSQSYGLEQGMALHRLQRHWSDVVGAQIASHTHPAEARRNTLYIVVDNAAWLHELSFFKPELLKKIVHFLPAEAGQIGSLHLKVGPLPAPLPAVPTFSKVPLQASEALLPPLTFIVDTSLKEAIRQAMWSHL
jgi:hypothetical protein